MALRSPSRSIPWPRLSAATHPTMVSCMLFRRFSRRLNHQATRAKSEHQPLQPRIFPDKGFEVIGNEYILEEEIIPAYKPQRFYPVRLGEVFHQRYQAVAKLGYGSCSTIWLGRDLQEHGFVVLKVYVNSSLVHRELPVYQHLDRMKSTHWGKPKIRRLIEWFEVPGCNGKHICLVQEPMGISLSDFQRLQPDRVFSQGLVKGALKEVLPALDFLHEEAHVVHTDIQTGNILLGFEKGTADSTLAQLEAAEIDDPTPRKVLEDRTIYASRHLGPTKGNLSLSDFGEARQGDHEHEGDIMPDIYRAPEVILGMKWSYPVDIWSTGLMMWDLFEPRRLFNPRDENKKLSDAMHLAAMVAVMGPPPLEFLRRSEKSLEFWDANGQWKGIVPIPADQSLEMREQRLSGQEQKEFLDLIRKILRWMPEERLTAREWMMEPWMRTKG